jgi:hypothetical protein
VNGESVDLAGFLLARIAEDETAARAVLGEHEMYDWGSYLSVAGGYGFSANLFAERFNPTRVLAECEAKRAIVQGHAETWELGRGDYLEGVWRSEDHTIRLMAAVYGAHPDYRSEWAP